MANIKITLVIVLVAISGCRGEIQFSSKPTKPDSEMSFQNLEDRLKQAGLDVERTASVFPNSMWFAKPGGGPNDPHWKSSVLNLENDGFGRGFLYDLGYLQVAKHSSIAEAEGAASSFQDIHQQPVFAWGPFVFKGSRAAVDEVKERLGGKK